MDRGVLDTYQIKIISNKTHWIFQNIIGAPTHDGRKTKIRPTVVLHHKKFGSLLLNQEND